MPIGLTATTINQLAIPPTLFPSPSCHLVTLINCARNIIRPRVQLAGNSIFRWLKPARVSFVWRGATALALLMKSENARRVAAVLLTVVLARNFAWFISVGKFNFRRMERTGITGNRILSYHFLLWVHIQSQIAGEF